MELSEASLVSRMHEAMKARETVRVNVLRGVIAAIKNTKVEQRVKDLPSDQIAVLIRREVKKRDEVIEIARRGGRSDVADQAEGERTMLECLLPALLTPEELEVAVRRLQADGATNIGAVMRGLQAEYPGRIDGKQASTIARRVLAEGS